MMNPVLASMGMGRGAPWSTIIISDGDRELTLTRRENRRRRGPKRFIVQRAADGEFYVWKLGSRNVRLAWPVAAPWFIRARIRRVVVVAEDGTVIGAFEVIPGTPTSVG